MKTATSSKHRYVTYLTKHLRQDLHDRLRVQAAMRATTIEDMVNVALGAGLPEVEAQTAQARAERRKANAAMEAS